MGYKPNFLHSNSSSHTPKACVSTLEGSSYHDNGTISKLADDKLPSFPLFKLPLELREYVYSHILVQDKQPLHLTRRPKFDSQPKNAATAILATNRKIYLEARRLFLSGNEFLIRGTLIDRKWLKQLGPEGRKQLRKLTFLNDTRSYSLNNYRTFNILSACPNLSLTIKVYGRQLVNLDRMGMFKYMHGFSCATMGEDRSGMERICYKHGFDRWTKSERKTQDECAQSLLRQLGSACLRKCRVHEGRDASISASTVHLDCEYGCPDCYHSGVGNWQWQCQ